MAFFSVALLHAVSAVAPQVRLYFMPKPSKDVEALREGTDRPGNRRRRHRAGDAYPVPVSRSIRRCRAKRSSVAGGRRITPERYAACHHVVASRRGAFTGPVDDALAKIGLKRRVVAVVPAFRDVVRLVAGSDLIGLVPRSYVEGLGREGGGEGREVTGFALPVATPKIAISAMWHPRMDADPAHRWLRNMVITVCREGRPATESRKPAARRSGRSPDG